MVSKSRWRKAQEYERSYWKGRAESIADETSSQLDWYGWRVSEMERRLSPFFDESQMRDAKVVEVGSGPIGIVGFLPWGERHAVDPLEDFYGSNVTLSKLRKSDVTYHHGQGENLPFDDNFASIVIIDNVIDHVHDATAVLNEIDRVLAEDGLMYFSVNVHTNWGAFLHRILSKTRIDKGHPYTFTPMSIRAFLSCHGFEILAEHIGDYQTEKRKDRVSKSMKGKIKAYAGLSEFVFCAIVRKMRTEGLTQAR